MKLYPTIIITTALISICAASPSALAQGTVIFNNGTGLVWQRTSYFDSTFIPVPKGGGYVQLYWAPAGTPYNPWSYSGSAASWYANNPGWALGPVVGFTTPTAGKFNGGALTLAPLIPTSPIDYVIIGWTGNSASFEEALNQSMSSVSDRFRSGTGDPLAIPPGLPVPLASSFGGLYITYIPEPSSFALAVLGAATLLAIRPRE